MQYAALTLLLYGAAIAQNVWTPQVSGTTNFLVDVVWADTQFIAVGWGGTILTSPDGATWTPQNSGTTRDLLSVAKGGNQLLVVGDGVTLRSTDGITWSSALVVTQTAALTSVVWDGFQFYALRRGSADIFSLSAGRWQGGPISAPAPLIHLTYEGRFLAVGNSGGILSSVNGITWTPHVSGTTDPLTGITWTGAQYVAVSSGQWVRTSPDLTTWTGQYSGTSLQAVVSVGDLLIAVGGGGAVRISQDGINWLARTSGTSNSLSTVRIGNSLLIAVGDLGTIITSPAPTFIYLPKMKRGGAGHSQGLVDVRGRHHTLLCHPSRCFTPPSHPIMGIWASPQ